MITIVVIVITTTITILDLITIYVISFPMCDPR
jgi:hypothetical protein